MVAMASPAASRLPHTLQVSAYFLPPFPCFYVKTGSCYVSGTGLELDLIFFAQTDLKFTVILLCYLKNFWGCRCVLLHSKAPSLSTFSYDIGTYKGLGGIHSSPGTHVARGLKDGHTCVGL